MKLVMIRWSLIFLLAACSSQSADVDWDDMNYAATQCGQDSNGAFISADCKARAADLNSVSNGRGGGRR